MFKAASAALAFLVLAAPAFAQSVDEVNASIDAVLGDHVPYAEAFGAIQAAVAADDAEAVAEWVAYPFEVTIDGEAYAFDGPGRFRRAL
jgi:hypothetical protein